MSSSRGASPLSYRRIGLPDLGVIGALDLGRVERFLGPLADILAAVRRGPAHAMLGIEAGGELIGFYVVHPDARDRSCWWLGWFAIDCRQQGHGYGRAAMAAIMARLRGVAGCRRVRLLVAPDNAPAMRLYGQAGFRRVGRSPATGEAVMECAPPVLALAVLALAILALAVLAQATRARPWAIRLRSAVRMLGAFHGPPAAV